MSIRIVICQIDQSLLLGGGTEYRSIYTVEIDNTYMESLLKPRIGFAQILGFEIFNKDNKE